MPKFVLSFAAIYSSTGKVQTDCALSDAKDMTQAMEKAKYIGLQRQPLILWHGHSSSAMEIQ